MITIYGYVPAFGVPDISPYVTKTLNYMTFTGLEYQHKTQDLATLDEDSPTEPGDEPGRIVLEAEALLRDHVKDKAGKKHDIVVLGHNVAQVRAQMEAYGLPGAVQH